MNDAQADPIPLAQPLLGEREEELVLEVLRSGRLSLGPRLAEFEQAFAQRVRARFASAVSSGNSAAAVSSLGPPIRSRPTGCSG